MFCHTIVLWHVGGGNFMLDTMLSKVLLDVASHVLTPSIGAEDLYLCPVSSSTLVMNTLSILPTSGFSCKGMTEAWWEESSMKVMKYL